MRLNKAEITAIAVTLLFAALTIGFRLGQRSVPVQFSVRTAGEAVPGGGESSVDDVAEEKRVNINTATLEELCRLDGIGEALARRIIDEREANGPFGSVEDITRVSGIGSGTLNRLRDQIIVGEGAPAGGAH